MGKCQILRDSCKAKSPRSPMESQRPHAAHAVISCSIGPLVAPAAATYRLANKTEVCSPPPPFRSLLCCRRRRRASAIVISAAWAAISPSDEGHTWKHVLISARRANPNRVRLSVGLPGQQPIRSDKYLPLKQPGTAYQTAVYVGLAVLVLIVFLLGRRKVGMLLLPGAEHERKYSLGLSQMAIWFCLIVFGWTYVSLMTKSPAHLSSSLLVLMGISSATAIGAVLVPTPKSNHAESAKPNRWLRDIVSDANGDVSLHRLQMFVWTVVLGIYFLISIFREYVMPDFDTQLLVLMGISSGTYIGFKTQENKA